MKKNISNKEKKAIFKTLRKANLAFQKKYPGDLPDRQPVHTVYGGAHLFSRNTATNLGRIALASLQTYAPDFISFAHAFGLPGHDMLPKTKAAKTKLINKFAKLTLDERKAEPGWLAFQVYQKVILKLETEPVEDFRIDFEDGYGIRGDEEEDATAKNAALEVAKGMEEGTLPPFIGIRIKPFTEEMKERGIRTLDIFLSSLVKVTDGQLPNNFVIMLPKVTIPEQITAMVKFLRILEKKLKLPKRALKMEMMVEQTQAIMDHEGKNPLRKFILASKGRCIATHFGTYDYTAANNITAKYQTMIHPVCDFAHHMTKVALSHTGIWLSDGATNIMPVAPNRGEKLTRAQQMENTVSVHNAWQEGYRHIRHSLYNGLYQGWDLNPTQLPMRYAAVFTFFLESYDEAVERLKAFMETTARATLVGDIFDDAATGQGLLNYFLRALNSGAISEADIMATGLTLEEIRTRSFAKILKMRADD